VTSDPTMAPATALPSGVMTSEIMQLMSPPSATPLYFMTIGSQKFHRFIDEVSFKIFIFNVFLRTHVYFIN
jgi:hypothetical protein